MIKVPVTNCSAASISLTVLSAAAYTGYVICGTLVNFKIDFILSDHNKEIGREIIETGRVSEIHATSWGLQVHRILYYSRRIV